jgi:DNA mismatch endonuclease, patch repair protein
MRAFAGKRNIKKPASTPPRPTASSLEVRRRMQATRRRDTPGEVALRSVLHGLGFRFRVDMQLPETRRRADIVFTRQRIAVFVDGCFWHGCPEHGTWPKTNATWWRQKIETNRRRDRDTDHRLSAAGWTVLRFWAHTDAAEAASIVARVLQGVRNAGRHSKDRGQHTN